MELELIANGVILDVKEGTTVSLNYAIQDILDPKKRKTNFSKTIVLEGSDVNNQFFEHIYDVNINTLSFNPRLKIPAIIRIGVNEVFSGNLNLLNITRNLDTIQYSVAIIGELSNIYKELKGKEIDFIDLTDLSHIRNKANIIDSWNNTEGYIYPHIVYGNKDAIYNQFFIYDLQPAIYVKTIFDRMITKLGYTYESNFLNSDYFKSLILTSNNEKILKTDAVVKEQTAFVGVEGDQIDVSNPPGNTPYNQVLEGPVGTNFSTNIIPLNRETPFTGPVGGDFIDFSDDLNQNFNGKVTIQNTGYYNINVGLWFYLTSEQSGAFAPIAPDGEPINWSIGMYVQRNNGTLQLIHIQSQQTLEPIYSVSGTRVPALSNTSQDSSIEFGANINELFLEQGEEIIIRTVIDAAQSRFIHNGSIIPTQIGVAIYDETPAIEGNHVSFLNVNPTNQSLGNEIITLNSLFDIKLDSLFDDIVKMFNLVIIEGDNKDLVIDTYDNYFSSKQSIKDWTDKLDRNRNIEINPLNKLDYNKYVLEYSQGKDWLNDKYFTSYKENYGTKDINIENDFSKKTERLKIGLEATPNSNQFMNDRSVPFLCDIVDEVTNWQFKQKKSKSRMLFVKRDKPTSEWFLRDVVGDNSTSFTSYTYCGMFDDDINPSHSLSFGHNEEEYNLLLQTVPTNHLTNEFHSNKLENVINIDSRLMTGYFHLTNSDIKEFDFRDVIFIDGSYWRVDKIDNYNPSVEGVTKVTLYKLLDELTQSNIQLTLGYNGQTCPSGVIIENGMYFADGDITRDCCDSLGGNWDVATNTCFAQQNGSGDVLDDIPPSLFKGNNAQKNGNTVNSPGAIVNGTNNYIGENTNVTAVLGNNNTINDGVTNVFIAGDNINASSSDTTYVNNITINGGISGIDILWVDLVGLMNTNSMADNAIYHITDRNITLEAITSNTYKPLCKWVGEVVQSQIYDATQNYLLASGRNYRTHRIWDTNSTVVLPDVVGGNPNFNGVIWNGKMWRLDTTIQPIAMNLTDEPGTSSMWTEVTRPTVINNGGFYFFSNEQKGFVVAYDLINDKINVVWDERGNKINSYLSGDVKLTDFGCTRIHSNDCGIITNNASLNNNLISPNGSEISNNRNYGNIIGNKLYDSNGPINPNYGSIVGNSNDGDIVNNLSNEIGFNSNNGRINDNSNNDSISNNSNNGIIINNSNSGIIRGNTNNGSIRDNTNNGSITDNSNSDNIRDNSNNGSIFTNSNLGEIRLNMFGGVIVYNSNNGAIYNNTNTSHIKSNSNSGRIINNSNIGEISLNKNNGDIETVPNTNGDINNNINNGNITGLVPGPITDPIVNK